MAAPIPKASVTAIQWTARSLAAIGIPTCVCYLGSIFLSGSQPPPPMDVGMAVFSAGIVLSGTGAILAFRCGTTAVCFHIMGSVVEATLLPTRISERTSPFAFGNLTDLLVLWVLFPLSLWAELSGMRFVAAHFPVLSVGGGSIAVAAGFSLNKLTRNSVRPGRELTEMSP